MACLALLSACNTTDALTPLVDIGDTSGSIRSSPVTQRDVERMAGTPQRSQAFASEPQQGGYHPAYAQAGSGYVRQGTGAPPTTCRRRPRARRPDSSSPAASAPIESQGRSLRPNPVSNAEAEEQDIAERRSQGLLPAEPPA
jgi:hypothetical protein